MDLIYIKEEFICPVSERVFVTGFWHGAFAYVSSIDKETRLPLVLIINEKEGPFLIPKEYCELMEK